MNHSNDTTDDVALSEVVYGCLPASLGAVSYRGELADMICAEVEAAYARDLAALRERAEVAEAKVAAVKALCDEWGHAPFRFAVKEYVRRVRAALADRPAGGEGR